MNRALWNKAVADSFWQLIVSSLILVAFAWIFVWLVSLFRLGAWGMLMELVPRFVNRMLGTSPAELATPTGRVSILYVHVVPMLVFIGWAVGRGSDAVSGGISDGTLELLLTAPVRRVTVLWVPAVVTALGSVLLGLALWLGTWIGINTVTLEGPTSIGDYLPGVVNMVTMTFCLTGLTTLLSSWDNNRWRTIWLSGGLFVVSLIVKLIARLWEPGDWLKYLSFLTAFEPQNLILLATGAGRWRWSITARCWRWAC